MLQIQADHLLCAEHIRFFQGHILKIRVIQPTVKAPSCLGDDTGKKAVLCLIDLEIFFPEKLHGFALAVKRSYHQVRGDLAGGPDSMKFVGRMEQQISLL